MKKIFTLIILAGLIPACCFAKSGSPRSKIMNAIEEYRGCEGFDVLKLGSLGTAILKSFTHLALVADGMDDDSRMAFSLIDGVKSIAIADYDGCSAEDKTDFTATIERILRHYEPILEAKDDGDIVKIYGNMSDDGRYVKDFILYTPSDCALICIFGKVPLEKAVQMATTD